MNLTTLALPALCVIAASHTCSGMEQQQQQQQQQRKITPWLQEHFPQQPDDAACRPAKDDQSQNHNDFHRLCDPDHVLPSLNFQHLANALRISRYTTHQDTCLTAVATNEKEAVVLEDGSSTMNENSKASSRKGLEIQMGVALVQKMDLSPFRTASPSEDKDADSGIEERAAETFGRYIHDTWGVGLDTEECGGAGVLLFLSLQDRAIFISRGSALEAYLTDRRLDAVIENMKDHLREEQYDTAILVALQDILAWIDKGHPTTWEHGMHIFSTILFPAIWLMAMVGVVVRTIWKDTRQRRDYARVASQLNEIDRARAEALQGTYCATSCPICLEEWEMEENETYIDGEQPRVAKIGSDGQPIKLLRCGHCMDESCWAEWVNSGRGTITKCPICQQDVGTENTAIVGQNQSNGNTTNSSTAHRRDQHDRPGDQSATTRFDHDNDFGRNANEDRILRQYRRERNFRLARLGNRYPQIIRPNQLQRWTQPTYEGSLVRDPSFVQSNPAVARPGVPSGGRSSRTGGGGFGGSSSGGGRSGRW